MKDETRAWGIVGAIVGKVRMGRLALSKFPKLFHLAEVNDQRGQLQAPVQR